MVAGGAQGPRSEHGADGTEYRTEYDRHLKVVSHRPDAYGPESFTVYAKDGQVLTFGGSATSRLEGRRVAITAVGPSTGGPKTWSEDHSVTVRYLWALAEVRDRSGNSLRVDYQLDEDDFGYELLPATIRYTGFSGA